MTEAAPSIAPAEAPRGFLAQFAGLSRAFWMMNIMEMFERLAYYGVRMVIPIYIAQADEIHGLHFSQTDKGTIFLLWALVQAGVPIFSGGFADRYGFKPTIALSIAIKVIGYLLMATQREFWPFTIGCLVLAFGTAIFKPGVQGTLVRSLNEKNSGVGWGTFYMLVNVGGFLGPPLAHFLYGISWPAVFYGCAAIVSLNFLMLFTYKEVASGGDMSGGIGAVTKRTFRNLMRPQLFVFILVMSGFWLMYYQLFDILPNFIVDWTDSRAIVQALHLGKMFTNETARGTMVAQEWMINLNGGLIVLFVVWVSFLVSKMKRVPSIFWGIAIGSIGLVLTGFTMSGWFCLFGIVVFSIGEMLASPKMYEYLGVIAPPGEKGLYMGYVNMPIAIGWAYGSFMGGHIYENQGDKANLALRWLSEHQGTSSGVERTAAMTRLQEVTGLDPVAATKMLWDAYHPHTLWYPFAAVGLASAVGIWLYSRWIRRFEEVDI